jgi:hypothetical protein
MKRKYIKPVTTVLMVETQNNYCAATSNDNKWVVGEFDENDQVHVANPTYDTGRIISDKDDAVHEYNPWDCGTW